MSLTDLQYRKRVIWVSMGLLFGVFTSVEFLRNLSQHYQHSQTMPAAFGLAFIGTGIYALVMATIVVILGFSLQWTARKILEIETKGNGAVNDTLSPVGGRPEGALEQKDVRVGDKLVAYIPGDNSSVLRYQLVTPPVGDEHTVEDGRGDLLLWVLNLDTNVTAQIDTATLGLTCSPDGRQTRYAIRYDEN